MPRTLAGCLVAFAVSASFPAFADLYVANSNNASVTVYPPAAVGAVFPSRTVAGAATALVTPLSVTVDTVNNELYVVDFFGQAIRVYPLGANGNVAPIRTLINGVNSGLLQPRQVIVDIANNEIAVASISNSIRVYPRTANGDIAPTRVISGTSTLLSNPLSLAFDVANGEYITSTFDAGSGNSGILVFPRTANGNVAPSRVIAGSSTLLGTNSAPTVAYDAVNTEYVARKNTSPPTPSAVVVFPRTASGNVAPARAIQGPTTGLIGFGGIVFDSVTNRYFTSHYNAANRVSGFPRTASGDTAPALILEGGPTGLQQPFGLAVDATGGPSGFGGGLTPIPALDRVGLAMLFALLAMAGFFAVRRHKRA
jgi:hypothetical protein